MRFLLRAAFWFSVVIVLLPGPAPEQAGVGPQIGASEAVSAASAAVSDMRRFCSRQPDACAVGSQAFAQFGRKAEAAAKALYGFLNDRLGSEHAGALAAAGALPAQNTLTPADLAPLWRGPGGRKDEAKGPS